MTEEQRAIGPSEAAKRLGVTTRTVQRWLREGRLPAVKVGSRLKVDASSLPAGPDRPPRSNLKHRTIRRLLVTNRGELVVRIARTCRRLGITCLALVPEDQARAWWARQADEVVPLATNYLDATSVLAAARQADADAIHPGYGFLAENADFADAVVAAGLAWVGPPGSAMRALGDKAAGRRLAKAAGVAILPGYDDAEQSDVRLSAEAVRIGFPVLVKPSAGGGGKGMHVVRAADELVETLATARREATASFGDDRLILERFISHPRHVEVQFLRDVYGGAVHLGERDCSLQRRHQKVIEESPSPAVDARLRSALGDAALRLAAAAGYVNAGTAEFLLDDDGHAFFLEVNARLQVEHPVTEIVTGRDLVADQLRIAAGEPLGFEQSDVTWRGHAAEARLYAEDPWAGFLPATGPVASVTWPSGDGVRVDAGVGQHDVVGTRYDPLLAKIIASGKTREQALDRLADALARTSVMGVTSNRGFLRSLVRRPEVRRGEARTDTIETTWAGGPDPAAGLVDRAFVVAAATLAQRGSAIGFRLNAAPRVRIRIDNDERDMTAPTSIHVEPGVAVSLDGDEVLIDVDGRAFRARLASPPTVDEALRHAQREHGAIAAVIAPMPGQVLAVRVSEGDKVEAGQTLVVLEAMKMENAVTAPAAATVASVMVTAGQQVQRGDTLVELD
ncbi:MAG: biotin carboxylase N-terminal domain-containing protein [Candidatus Limnocylindrales bacterium]